MEFSFIWRDKKYEGDATAIGQVERFALEDQWELPQIEDYIIRMKLMNKTFVVKVLIKGQFQDVEVIETIIWAEAVTHLPRILDWLEEKQK